MKSASTKTATRPATLDYDLMVAMNGRPTTRTSRRCAPGGYLLYDSTWPLDPALLREDITFLGVPLADMCNRRLQGERERILMKNIAYAGALVRRSISTWTSSTSCWRRSSAARRRCIQSNHKALATRLSTTRRTISNAPCPIRLERMDANADKVLIDGNTAAALGCVYAGATVAAWYPITPGYLGDGCVPGPLRAISQGPGDW